MPCMFGILDPAEECRGTECQTCTGWGDLCAGCGKACAKGAGLCPTCEKQLQAQSVGPNGVVDHPCAPTDVASQNIGNMTIKITTLILALLLAVPAQAKHRFKEEYYQAKWCKAEGGTTEYVLPDRTRVDCLTSENAIEFDFGSKHYESIGQAIKYGMATGKRPGIVLIIENNRDAKKWAELQEVVIFLRERFGLRIDTWWMEGE